MQKNRNIWVDHLRSFLTVLVVAHHAMLAYTTFARFDEKAYINSTHPVVDEQRWIGLDILQNFNDVFFMALMFLIGGLFLSKSLERKSLIPFLLNRMYRLFIPFLLLGTFFMLIAHFPAYYIAHQHCSITAYVVDFFTVEKWPVGPPWFIWVLFVFNVIFACVSPAVQKIVPGTNRFIISLTNKPLLLFIVLLFITWLLYVPLAYTIGAGTWVGWLPFDFQLSRVLLYFGYFMIGVLIGNTDFNTHIFSTGGAVVKNWRIWATLAVAVYDLLIISSPWLTGLVKAGQLIERDARMMYYTIYASSCVLSCLAFITIFRKLAIHQSRWWNSLSANAYLIYLTHYIFVLWAQFTLMPYHIPAFLKFLIAFITALGLSWAASSLLRKIKWVRTYL